MQVERSGTGVRVMLTSEELGLLRRALERASFIETPPGEQEEIARFCARALDSLPPAPA